MAQTTPYQRIVLTQQAGEGKTGFRLFLNGNLQFAQRDEYRYHEALVHPAMSSAKSVTKVLVLGGGDGLAAREILKYKDVKDITLVDLDGGMTTLFRTNSVLTSLNNKALLNYKVTVFNKDAFLWIKQATKKYDVVIIDFPDPSNYSLGKLYSVNFYQSLQKVLAPDAVVAIQTTSPFFAPKSFWCINKTVKTVFSKTDPYHVYVPSFGEWGFTITSNNPTYDVSSIYRKVDNLRFYNYKFKSLNQFADDMQADNVEANRLDNQILVRYFDEEWGKL